MARKDMTTINITLQTKERIDRHGRFKETYDDMVNRLLDIVDEHERVKKK